MPDEQGTVEPTVCSAHAALAADVAEIKKQVSNDLPHMIADVKKFIADQGLSFHQKMQVGIATVILGLYAVNYLGWAAWGWREPSDYLLWAAGGIYVAFFGTTTASQLIGKRNGNGKPAGGE